MREGTGAFTQAVSLAKALNIPLLDVNVMVGDKPVFSEYMGLKVYHPVGSFYNTLKELNIDVLLINSMPGEMIGEIQNIKKICKIITIAHLQMYEHYVTDNYQSHLLFVVPFFNLSDVIICLSEKQKEILESFVTAPIVVIPPGIDYTKYKSIEANPSDEDFIMVSRISPIKNHLTPYLAMKRVNKTHPNSFLKIYGHSTINKKFSLDFIRTLKLEEHVGLFDYIDHDRVITETCNSRALICSSFIENCSVSVLEAKALGVPVIEEDPFSPKEFADKMIDVLENYEKHKKRAEKERSKMHKYDIKLIAKQYRK
ncbi:hypothetical protein LCGC14_1023510, partial [marine sediment metagenome]